MCLGSRAGRPVFFRGDIRETGCMPFLAFHQHKLSHGIAGKVIKDRAIRQLRRRNIASLEILRSLPGHRAELLIPIADA